jgi:hypothetical protein
VFFEEVVQIIALKRFGGAPHYNQLAPLRSSLFGFVEFAHALMLRTNGVET